MYMHVYSSTMYMYMYMHMQPHPQTHSLQGPKLFRMLKDKTRVQSDVTWNSTIVQKLEGVC